MLIRFSVSNFLSIKDQEEVSFVAHNLVEPRQAISDIVGLGDVSLLPCAIIYGANASGKSNLLNAMSFTQYQVLNSHIRNEPDEGLKIRKFMLDPEYSKKPTMVEVEFLVDGVRYSFGFEASNDGFTSEWLFSYPEGRKRKLYSRTGFSEIDFGPNLKGQKQVIADLMRPNSLFISTAVQNNHELLTQISKFFIGLDFLRNLSVQEHTIDLSFNEENAIDRRTIAFLNAIGTGVVSYRQKSEPHDDETLSLFNDFSQVLKKHLSDDSGAHEFEMPMLQQEIELAHLSSEGKEVFFRPAMESSGTRRLLMLLNSVFKALDTGSVVVVDELDASLHTHAIECIVELFANREYNAKNAQLIAATHDTNLLNSNQLRRDEIWFSEKDHSGASRYYSLSDIRSRSTDDFEAGYLQGRYGAIPYSGSILDLMKLESENSDG